MDSVSLRILQRSTWTLRKGNDAGNSRASQTALLSQPALHAECQETGGVSAVGGYEGWRASGRSVYEPLLWSLRVASVCPLHRRSLISVCPHCERPIRPIMSSSRPGYCGRCGGWLGAMPDGPLPEELSPASSNYWV